MASDGLKYLKAQLRKLAKKAPYSYIFKELAHRKLANTDTPVDALIVSLEKRYKQNKDFFGEPLPEISKIEITEAFYKLEEIGLGRYKRVYLDKKPRFEWQNFSCINISKYALGYVEEIELYYADLTYSDQLIVDMHDGRQCFLRLPYGFEKSGRKWKRFLEEILDKFDDELEALETAEKNALTDD